jgi:hypothetical protein
MKDAMTKKVLAHIKEDSKEFKKQLSDDKKLKKALKHKMASKKK